MASALLHQRLTGCVRFHSHCPGAPGVPIGDWSRRDPGIDRLLKSPTATETGSLPVSKSNGARNVPSPFPTSTEILPAEALVATRSRLPSPVKIAQGDRSFFRKTHRSPEYQTTMAPRNVPSPLPSSTEILLAERLTTARSRNPSPFRKPTAMPEGASTPGKFKAGRNVPFPLPRNSASDITRS